MIIQEQGDQYILIRQTDHAVLAGFFARAWGTEHFKRPEPFESFCLAAAEHDNGWSEWELRPGVDPKSFAPYTFMSIPTEEHIALYQKGIERVVKTDRYAGLLVNMHCVGLYDRARATIPGFSAKYVKSTESEIVSEFLQRLRLQQLRLKVDLRADPATRPYSDDGILQTNVQRLEALDRLSLYFCLGLFEGAAIDAVPGDEDGHEIDWNLQPSGKTIVTMTPYPFRKDPLEISILARRIPKRPYPGQVEFQKILAQAPYFALNYTLYAGARAQSRRAAV